MSREAEPRAIDPLAFGVDVARYGKNASVIFFRKGRDAKSIPRRRFQGLSTIQLADKISEAHHEYHSNGIFIDGGGVGGGVVDNVRAKALHCYEVQFGAKDDTPHIVFGSAGEKYANKRSGIYGALRAWLDGGAIPDDPEIKKQFTSIKYVFNKRDEIQLISKEDMLKLDPTAEFDDIDALATTFAHAIALTDQAGSEFGPPKSLVESEYEPYSAERMSA
jgi:hypothetical protein